MQLQALDVEGIMAFAERALPSLSDARLQASVGDPQDFAKFFLLAAEHPAPRGAWVAKSAGNANAFSCSC